MKKFLLVAFFTGITIATYAQWRLELPESQQTQQAPKTIKKQSKSGFDVRNLTFGGGIGLQFGDYTLVNIAPQVGYNFSKMFNAGLGLTYTYWKDSYYERSVKYKETNSYFGFNVYGKFYPIDYIVIMAQPEINRMWQTVKYGNEKYSKNKFVPAVLVGAGLRLGPMTAMIQYDVVQDDYSPYGNNIFYSVGYTFSF